VTTAVDSSILLAIFRGESNAEELIAQLQTHLEKGLIVVCDVVVAEVGAFFDTDINLNSRLHDMEIRYSPIEFRSACHAGRLYREYRRRGGGRATMIPDFLIASHALLQADQLWAVDRGYYKGYYKPLKVVPSV